MRCISCLRVVAAPLLVASLTPGCAHVRSEPQAPPAATGFLAPPAPDDPWSPKISGWQQRERAVELDLATAPASVSGPGDAVPIATEPSLREKFTSFRQSQQRRQAQEVAAWIQENARSHYRPDGAFDHWATLEETLAADGDDCDALELLAFNLLRELGFSEDEVFRRSSIARPMVSTTW